MCEPLPKECALQHLGYMSIVRKLACAKCATLAVRREFCHADRGKGMAIKTDCRRGWPGCPSCHFYVGTSGSMTKAERRAFEDMAGAATRMAVLLSGCWPKRLPRWIE